MQIQNRRTGRIEQITNEQWEKLVEVQLQKYYNVISREDVFSTDNKLEIEKFINQEKKSVETAQDSVVIPTRRKTNK